MGAKAVLRSLGLAILVALILAGALSAALAFPAPLFSYHAERGRLSLYSDRPFDQAKAQESWRT